MTKPEILIADDELHTREALIRYLRGRFSVTAAEDGAEAIAFLQNRDFDLVLTDLRMPGADGMGVLEAALSKAVKPECIVFSAYGSIESAVAAVKAGEFLNEDYHIHIIGFGGENDKTLLKKKKT